MCPYQRHIAHLFKNPPQPRQPLFHTDPDTFMNEHSLDAALKAAGAGVMELISLWKKLDNAFCAVRPSGHHAERDQAMGFCFFNNISIAAAHALEKYHLERVAIIDFDVHHGNGSEDIFENNERIMVCSSNEHTLYPYSGRPTVLRHLINCPLSPGSAGPEFRMVVQKECLPALEAFQPQFIFISAGFDAHWQDGMAQLQLNESDYRWVTQKIAEIAHKHAGGRIVSMLEGGYFLDSLGRSAEQHIRVLMGLD